MIKGVMKYWDLGRSKASGTLKIECKDEDEFNNKLYNEFSKYLLSSGISFDEGKIFAGFRHVGNFEFIAIGEGEE